MTNRLSWIVAVAVLVLGLVELTTTQRFAPSIWDYPYNKAQESPAPAFAPQSPISPARYSTAVGNPPPPMLLNSFFPAVMQLLHYFSGRMQYAELHSTTIAPPFTGGDYAVAGQSGSGLAGTTTPTPFTTTTTRRTPTTTTRRPKPSVESTTQIHAPGLFAPTPQKRPVHVANRPPQRTTTTRRPYWTSTKTSRRTWATTTRKPPPRENTPWPTTKRPFVPASVDESGGFFAWFFENRPKEVQQRHEEIEYDLLDPLPKALLNEIDSVKPGLPAVNDEDNAREFLKKFDDSYGRYVPSQTGNKKMAPTKPYVEMLVLYDLMMREAKLKMLNEYHGYTDAVLETLHRTSFMSSERQLHYVMSQVAASSEVESPNIKSRMNSIIKDLESPNSVTAQTLRFIPPMVFAL